MKGQGPKIHSLFLKPAANRKGFTFLEIIMILVVIAVAVPVLLIVLGDGAKMGYHSELQITAANAAQALMEEINSKRFDETAVPPPYTAVSGPEAGEARTACTETPSTYDDIDDYNGYSEICSGYTRTVTVCYVNPADLNTCIAAGTTDYKRVSISITYAGDALVDLVTMISNH